MVVVGHFTFVIPAKAGIQNFQKGWIPDRGIPE